jgi:hypothetical protein
MESTVLPLELAHEHRNYLPLFGVLLAAGWALAYALEDKRHRSMGIALAGTALLYSSFVTGCARTNSAKICGAPRSKPCIIRHQPACPARGGACAVEFAGRSRAGFANLRPCPQSL